MLRALALATVLLPFLARPALAGEPAGGDGVRAFAAASASPAEVWLNAGVLSYHFERGRGLREDNWGLGGEVVLRNGHAVTAGSFINSDRARSRYAAFQWRPLRWRPGGARLSAGLAAGAFDGYPGYRDGGWFPAALPFLALEGARLGLNLYLVPDVPGRVHGALAFQAKLRVW